jgi:membrane protease YdiL (CAAX protease family)
MTDIALPPDDPWLNGLATVVVFGSVGAWIYIVARWRWHGEVLPFEPRRPVPWGPPAAILAAVFALMAVSSLLVPANAAAEMPQVSTGEIAVRILSLVVSQLLLVGGFFFVIAVFYGAARTDLGLPTSIDEGLREVVIGFVTCLATLLPVRIVQGILMWLMGREDELTKHPLIETLTSSGGISFSVMLLALVSAVVVAPICEEITFRLLLQGWLEKWECDVINRRQSISGVEEQRSSGVEEQRSSGVEEQMDDYSTTPLLHYCSQPAQSSLPPIQGIFGLPYGWMAIYVSSFLFGIAHFGYGPEPIPLFLFAIVLGYVFQRTHRILPCIVAHALFNLVSMVALWRMIVLATE